MNEIRAEFLSLKYRGIRTPWEIDKDKDQFGWQCRKYIRWKAVHENKGDAKTLKEFADKLIDQQLLDVKVLPTINAVFEKVQRWRKDRDSFSVEPDLREGYEVLARTLRIASENPAIVRTILSRSSMWSSDISGEDAIARFLACLTGDFLKAYPGSPTLDLEVARKDFPRFEKEFTATIKQVYAAYGLASPRATRTEALVVAVLRDLGIPYALSATSILQAAQQTGEYEARIVVEEIEDRESVLVIPRYAQGQLILRVNRKHPWFKVAALELNNPESLSRVFAECAANATLDMLGDIDTIDQFFKYLGLSLQRRAAEFQGKISDKNKA
jgi:hypothetical protein